MAIMHNVGTINEAYSLPSSSHLRCRDYTFFSRTAFLLHAIVLPMLHQNRFHTIFTTYLSSLLYESPSYASSHPSTTSFLPRSFCEVKGCPEFDLEAVLLPFQVYA